MKIGLGNIIKTAMIAVFCFTCACKTTNGQANSTDPGNTMSVQEKNAIVQKLIREKNFLGIFKRALEVGEPDGDGEMNYLVSGPVEQFIKTHCETKADVIALLKKNGFKVYVNSADLLGQEYKRYDEVVSGERANRIIRFYRYISYGIFVLFKDGKIEKVIANAGSDGL